MIYTLAGSVILVGFFLWLWVRGAVANGRLRTENEGLAKNVSVTQKQLEIAANHPDTPADLAKRMREGTL